MPEQLDNQQYKLTKYSNVWNLVLYLNVHQQSVIKQTKKAACDYQFWIESGSIKLVVEVFCFAVECQIQLGAASFYIQMGLLIWRKIRTRTFFFLQSI